jgi:5-methylcytosine-specific restriction endonuclease McrA
MAAKRVTGGHWIADAARYAIYRRDGFACVYCGARERDGNALSLDHVRPRPLGGSDAATNLVTACTECNAAKRDLTFDLFTRYLRTYGRPTRGLAARVARQLARPIDLAAGAVLAKARRARR